MESKENFTMKSKKDDFECLFSTVRDCKKCPRMRNRKKVLSFENGNIHSKVVFIAEAPGRLGAELRGIPLCGDATGRNFDELLKGIGWKREDVFITNAVLCNPLDEEGNNSKPKKQEIINCKDYLERTLELIKPEIIVTLGVTALKALKYIKNHDFVLEYRVAQKLSWNNMSLFPLYHPSPKAIKHRSRDKQKADFCKLSSMVDPIKGMKKPSIL
jgi:uracil-DNA glycosylase family 4